MLRVWNSFSSSLNRRGAQIQGTGERRGSEGGGGQRMMARCVWISTIITTFMMLKTVYYYVRCDSLRSQHHHTSASIHAFVQLYHIVYAGYHHLSRCPLVSVGQRDEVIVTAMLNSNGSFIKFTTLFSLNRPTTTYQMLRLGLTSSLYILYGRVWVCI